MVLTRFYRELCDYWLKRNLNNNTHSYIEMNALSLFDVEIGGIIFDFAYASDRGYYAYFDCVLGEGLTGRLWEEIDQATTQQRPFYKNEYYLLTVN